MFRNGSAIMRLLKRPRQYLAKLIQRRQIEDAVPLSGSARPDGHAPGAALRYPPHSGQPPRARRALQRQSGLRPDRHTALSGNRLTVGRPHRERPHRPEHGRQPGIRQGLWRGLPLRRLRQPHHVNIVVRSRRETRRSQTEPGQRRRSPEQGTGRSEQHALYQQSQDAARHCLPLWNIHVPCSQYATETPLVGSESENTAARNYLETRAVAQHGQVYAQIFPTDQDSGILISRIARGASYRWRAWDEGCFREYSRALTSGNFFLHLKIGWRTLPEPIPAPHKYERRMSALGLAYEFIAVCGSAYHLDLSRQYSLAGATRHVTADWRAIPLLSAVPQSDSALQSANLQKTDLIGDRSRKETMSRFVTDEPMASPVREKPQELFNRRGRDVMREGMARYCWEVLEPAIEE